MILAVPKNTLTAKNQSAISKKGYIIIECDDPEKIRIINPEQSMDNSDWFMAALKALTKTVTDAPSKEFVVDLFARLKKKEEPVLEEAEKK